MIHFSLSTKSVFKQVDKLFLSNQDKKENEKWGGFAVLSKRGTSGRNQLEIIALDDLVPADQMVRKIEDCIDFDFIYDLTGRKGS